MKKEITVSNNIAAYNNATNAMIDEISKLINKPLHLNHYQNLLEIFEELDADSFLSLRENRYFKNWLSILDVESLPSLNTPLAEVRLPDKFLKLFNRLNKVSQNHAGFKVGDTLGDVAAMTTSDLASLAGVGSSYTKSLLE